MARPDRCGQAGLDERRGIGRSQVSRLRHHDENSLPGIHAKWEQARIIAHQSQGAASELLGQLAMRGRANDRKFGLREGLQPSKQGREPRRVGDGPGRQRSCLCRAIEEQIRSGFQWQVVGKPLETAHVECVGDNEALEAEIVADQIAEHDVG